MGNLVSEADIAAFRRFNRFHTQLVGALDERHLDTDFTLPQIRVFYEVANALPGALPSARGLSQSLHVDTGYLSRVISGLERDGLIHRSPAVDNAKRLELSLTEAGREVFAGLNAMSTEQVAAFLAPLAESERRQAIGAMNRIQRLLGKDPGNSTFVLRDPEPGDLGWITHRQAKMYAAEYGWDWTYEALVSKIVSQFATEFIPGRERCWVAEREGEIVGSVFIVRHDEEIAKLRLLYVEPDARGLGLGRKLVDETLRFAQAKGYKKMTLWTNDVLASARRIYEAAGFELVTEEPHHSFGKDLVGQVWERDLLGK